MMEHKSEPGRYLRALKWGVITVLLITALFSCRSMGPKTIPADGFNYNARIAHQQNEQLLLNIVRLRYGEVPLFLHVSSMIKQYSRSAVAGASAVDLFNNPAAGANASGIRADRPTITYTPMSGQAYSKSTFGVIQVLLSLARDGSQAVAPLISIGN